MIEELTIRFYQHNPSLASAMVGWGFLGYVQALLLGLIMNNTTNGLIGILCCIMLFLSFQFEKRLKKVVIFCEEPRILRNWIRKGIRTTKKEKWYIYILVMNFFIQCTYWIGVLCFEDFTAKLLFTIIFFFIFEGTHLIYTEIEKIIKK